MGPDGYDLTGRVALVTGGGEGIGAATARLLSACGAETVIAGRTEATLTRTAQEIEAATGRKCLWFAGDMRDETNVKSLIEFAIASFGRIDILVNNVGWGSHGPLNGMTTDHFRGEFAINLETTFFCAREVAQHFIAQGSGAIVNVSSVAGTKGVPGLSAYSAAKAAIQMFTRVAAAEWGPQGIRVNCVAPGLIATPNASKDFEQAGLDVAALCRSFPLGRPGKAEDVAKAIVFLASDAASYITGVTLAVDGGPT
jgi:NAD(P)-dependent dehydrogenase (short-subunit alcohol dehydrogenase family)